MSKVGLIVPTLNAGSLWESWLKAFEQQTRKPDCLLVIDSSSSDDTVALARAHGFDVQVIPKSEFNHGGTRQFGVNSAVGDGYYRVPDSGCVIGQTRCHRTAVSGIRR